MIGWERKMTKMYKCKSKTKFDIFLVHLNVDVIYLEQNKL